MRIFGRAFPRFGKDSLNECAESTGVESNAAASPLAVDQELVEEAETSTVSTAPLKNIGK